MKYTFLLKSIFITTIFFSAAPLFAATAPTYTEVKKKDGDTLYVERGILGSKKLYKCIVTNANCTPIETIPVTTSLTAQTVQSIVFKNADLSVQIALSRDQNTVSGLFYSKDDYTPYRTALFPFQPARAMFSDDGTSIIFFGTATNGKYSLFRLSLSDFSLGPVQQFLIKNIYTQKLSPDGKWLAYYIPASDSTHYRTVGLYSIEQNKYFSFTTKRIYWDLEKEANRLFAFSPSGNYFAYLDDRDGYQRPYMVKLSSTMKDIYGTKVGRDKSTMQDIVFSDDTLLYVGNGADFYNWQLFKYDPILKKSTALASTISYGENIVPIYDGAVVMQLHTEVFEPIKVRLSDGVVTRFNFSDEVTPAPILDATTGLPVPEILPLVREPLISNKTNATVISAKEVKKTDTKPLVVWLHGGPYRESARSFHPWESYGVYDWTLDSLAETAQARIVKVDYPGSFGFGISYSASIQTKVGNYDMNEVMATISAVKKKYKTDKVYLVGNSYGGYLAMRTLVGYPATITGALSINGVTDWSTLLFDLQTSVFNTLFYGPPGKNNRAYYDKASIIHRLKNLKDTHKLVVMQSTADGTIPTSQADYLKERLVMAKRTAEFIPLQGQDHVLSDPVAVQKVCETLFSLITASGGPDKCIYSK